MPGIVSRAVEVINSQLPSTSSAFGRVLGTALPLDPFLKGTVRFARKIGEINAVMLADNTTSLLTPARRQGNGFLTGEIISWIEIGSQLLLDTSELITVTDFTIDEAANTMEIEVAEKFLATHSVGSMVLLWGHPVEVTAVPEAAGGIQQITVTSSHKIYDMDEISSGFAIFELTSAVLANTLTDAAGNVTYTYQLTFTAEASTRWIDSHLLPVVGGIIYLRAWPAYEQPGLCLPVFPLTQTSFGPFCVDWLSGVTTENTPKFPLDSTGSFQERMQITAQDAAGNELFTQEIDKNFLIMQEHVQSDMPLFWDKLRGTLNWNGKEMMCLPDTLDDPAFQLHYKCTPQFQPGQITSWRMVVTNPAANPDIQVTFELTPGSPQSTTIPSGTAQSITVSWGTDPIDRIYIGINAVTGTITEPVLMGDWYIDQPPVRRLGYVLVARVTSRYRWGSTGIFLKPIFLSTEYLKARLGMNAVTNNGLLAIQP